MHELGESSAKDHAAIGTLASELGIDHLVCIAADEYASALTEQDAISVHRYLNKSGAADIAMNFNPGDVVLVKASRSEKFEELAEAVKGLWQKKIDEAIKENGEAQ
jgi:UDP-N-acetylmuramoyl-tripeptide--D-alanyl-D-alanine ligase